MPAHTMPLEGMAVERDEAESKLLRRPETIAWYCVHQVVWLELVLHLVPTHCFVQRELYYHYRVLGTIKPVPPRSPLCEVKGTPRPL